MHVLSIPIYIYIMYIWDEESLVQKICVNQTFSVETSHKKPLIRPLPCLIFAKQSSVHHKGSKAISCGFRGGRLPIGLKICLTNQG